MVVFYINLNRIGRFPFSANTRFSERLTGTKHTYKFKQNIKSPFCCCQFLSHSMFLLFVITGFHHQYHHLNDIVLFPFSISGYSQWEIPQLWIFLSLMMTIWEVSGNLWVWRSWVVFSKSSLLAVADKLSVYTNGKDGGDAYPSQLLSLIMPDSFCCFTNSFLFFLLRFHHKK